MTATSMPTSWQPLTPATWPDFEQAVGCEQGAEGGCWCTWWRLARGEWGRLGRSGRKQYFRDVVDSGRPVGIVAFKESVPYGWCAIAPVADYPVISRSPVVKPSLREGDWFVSCFFIKAGHRRSGAMHVLLDAAIDFAISHGASAIEACPRDAVAGSGASDLFVGKSSVFLAWQRAGKGFRELHRHRHDRPLLRFEVPVAGS